MHTTTLHEYERCHHDACVAEAAVKRLVDTHRCWHGMNWHETVDLLVREARKRERFAIRAFDLKYPGAAKR